MPDDRNCVPLCGASRAYGRFAKWWQHEPQRPARDRDRERDRENVPSDERILWDIDEPQDLDHHA